MKKVTIRKKGKKPITFNKGGLHKSLGVKANKPISPAQYNAALSGKKGKLAKKQALFKKNVLTGRKKHK
jgi:hypothetical protein